MIDKALNRRQEQTQAVMQDLFTIKQYIPRAHRRAQQRVDLTLVHWHVLRLLEGSKLATMGDVAKNLCVSKGAATQIIDTLVEEGLVNRQPDEKDRRIVRLELTRKSRKLSQEFHQYITDSFVELFAALSDEELATYATLTHKISSTIQGETE